MATKRKTSYTDRIKSIKEASKNMDFDNPDVKEALQLAAVGDALQTALSNSELTPEQEARMKAIQEKE